MKYLSFFFDNTIFILCKFSDEIFVKLTDAKADDLKVTAGVKLGNHLQTIEVTPVGKYLNPTEFKKMWTKVIKDVA